MRPPTLTPPRVLLDADLAWVLRGAFARDLPRVPPGDPERALSLARKTQLSGRIAARLGAWRGSSPLGRVALGLSDDYYANVAKETLLVQLQRRLAALAESLGLPIIALKFAALRATEAVVLGSRPAADLDVLLPQAGARAFWNALVAAGFARTNTHEYPHQLEALVDPYGAFVDVHLHLPGVVVERGSFATAEQLAAHGLVSGQPSSLLVPSAGVLGAHLISHALVQNRATPQSYSPLRMLADILDLRAGAPNVVQLASGYLAPQLGATCEALQRLCVALSAGELDGSGFEGSSEGLLLRHCLAARLDAAYADRLRAGGLANKLRDGSSVSDVVRYLFDLFYPAPAALDVLYGPRSGSVARFRRRLWRPVDVIARGARQKFRGR